MLIFSVFHVDASKSANQWGKWTNQEIFFDFCSQTEIHNQWKCKKLQMMMQSLNEVLEE